MIPWTKIDNQTSIVNNINKTSVFYNIIKEIPTKTELANGTIKYELSALRLEPEEHDHLKIYINGVLHSGTYSNLLSPDPIYGGFILNESFNFDDTVYCEYIPSNEKLMFNEITIADLDNTVTNKKILIERVSITLTHDILDEIINRIKNLEAHLFEDNGYNFSSFMIYHNRADNSEVSKMHITETVDNLQTLRYILDTTNEIDTTSVTYDPISKQEAISNEVNPTEYSEVYDIIHANLITSIREQLYKIEYTTVIDL